MKLHPHPRGRRLHQQIYLAFLIVAALCLVSAGLAAWAIHGGGWGGRVTPTMAAAVRFLGDSLPPEGAPGLQEAVDARSRRLLVDISVFDEEGGLLASAGERLAAPGADAPPVSWIGGHHSWGVRVRMEDGRWVAAAARGRGPDGRLVGVLGVVLLVLAGATWPLARRITRRLERLRRAVESLGAGDLSARVEVRGRDEVADLALAFNRSAAQVEALVMGQRRMLASASHELRSPLARLRMALELMEEGSAAGGGLRAEAVADVEELDALVGDLLLASRLQTVPERGTEPVDLGAIARAEAERVGALATGEGTVTGDARMIRRLIRNLLENAVRHGAPPIELRVEPQRVEVLDRGPGVEPGERTAIFEPFYRPAGHDEGRDGGVGLGLALVRDIARHHGGDVKWEARDGGGSRFVATFS